MNNNPEKLGKFIIEAELGKGSMGVVYKAVDPFINRTVALKTISRDLLADLKSDLNLTDTIIIRFKREAQAAGLLNHPNIVSVYEYGEDQNTAFIAMEFVQGRCLKEIFDQNERFDMNTIIKLMSQILGALAYSHKHGIVHRDIKPANIIIMSDGQVKITDFGIAHIESSNLTQSGMMLGTPHYMSPEQFMGQPVDGRSDLFSAGIIFYQFVTGENPFDGRTMATVMHKVLSQEPLDSINLNYQLSMALNQVIMKSLAKRPEDRHQSAEAFSRSISEAFAAAPTGQKKQSAESLEDNSKTIILSEPTAELEGRNAASLDATFNPYKTFFVSQVEPGMQAISSPGRQPHPDMLLQAAPTVVSSKFLIFSLQKKRILCGVAAVLAVGLIFGILWFTAAPKATAIPDIQNDQTAAHIPPAIPESAQPAGKNAEYAEVVSMLSALGQSTAAADLSLWTEKNQFVIGDRIHYYFKASRDCQVVIICLTTDKKVAQIFPNRYQTSPQVLAGQTYVLMDESADRALVVTGPAGQEEVIAFVSEQPLQLFPADFSQQPFIELSDSNEALKTIHSRIQTAHKLNISQKRIQYQIIDR